MCYIVYPASYYAIDNFSQKIIGGHSFFPNHLFVHIITKFVGKDNHAIFLFVDDGFHLHFQFQKFGFCSYTKSDSCSMLIPLANSHSFRWQRR